MTPKRIASLTLVLIPLLALTAGAEVQVERTFLPHGAAPSSFAIGLPGGISFCFDPVRGGVSYVWTGGFVDLASVRPGIGKFTSPVTLLGPIVYLETGAAPLRRGDPAREPRVEFKGYTLRDDAVEFRYTVDGILVREEVRASAGRRGLIRRFDVAGASDAAWWYVNAGKPPMRLGAAGATVLTLELPFEQPAP